MTALFFPLELRETPIPNRVTVSPMCQYSCENRDGLATDWHRTQLGSRAVGGITTPEQADAIVANDRADLAVVGREHPRDPYVTLDAADALDATDEISGPSQYRRAFGF